MSNFKVMKNLVLDSTVDLIASTEDTEFPVSNLQNYLRSKVWRTTSTTAQYLEIDLNSVEDIDSFALVFNDDQVITISPLATIKIQANATPVWTSPSVDVTVTIDETQGLATYFWSSVQSYRYWRLYITDPTNPYGYLEIPKVVLSSSIEPEHGPEVGWEQELTDLTKETVTEYGQRYFDVKPFIRKMKFNLPLLDETNTNELEDLYRTVGISEPICVCIDSLGTTLDKDRVFIYGCLDNSFTKKHRAFNYFDVEFNIVECM